MHNYLFQSLFLIHLYISKVELLDHMVILCLIFLRNCWGFALSYCFFTVAAPLYIPTSNTQGFIFFHIFAKTFSCFFFFNDSYPDECKVVSHCGFDLYLPGFHGDAVVKNWPAVQETVEMWVQSLGREDPLK